MRNLLVIVILMLAGVSHADTQQEKEADLERIICLPATIDFWPGEKLDTKQMEVTDAIYNAQVYDECMDFRALVKASMDKVDDAEFKTLMRYWRFRIRRQDDGRNEARRNLVVLIQRYLHIFKTSESR